MAKKTAKQGEVINIITKDIITLSIDRSAKSLATWKSALQTAESKINPNRRLLYDLYADIELDLHLSGIIAKRHLAISNTDIVFSTEDGEQHPEVTKLIDTEFFGQLLKHILDSEFYGHSLIDLQTPDLLNIDALQHQECEIIDRRFVKPEFGLVVNQPAAMEGQPYREEPFRNKVLEVGRKRNLGLYLKIAPWILYKRGDIDDWATFNELFVMPLRKGKYNPNMPGEKELLTQAMEETAGKPYVIVPEGSDVEYVESRASGNNQNYEVFARFCDEQTSKIVLGNTLGTDTGKNGNRSLGQVHEGVEEAIARADRRFVQKVLNSKFKAVLEAAGYSNLDGYKFDFKEEEETLSTSEQLKNDIEIHTKVGSLKRDYFTEKYNVMFDEAAIALQEKVVQEETENGKKGESPKASKPVNLSDFDNEPPNRFLLFWEYLKDFFIEAPNP
jgi:Protein of unknown function (DUF935)